MGTKEIFKIAEANIKAAKAVQKCQMSSCKPELTASQEQAQIQVAKVKALIADLSKNKITFEKFTEKTKKITADIIESDVTKKIASCSIAKCQPKVIKMFEAFISMYQHDCKVEKKKDACEKFERAVETLKTKPFTVEGYIKMLKMMTRLA